MSVHRGRYYACCAEVDAGLGGLFEFLRERGEYDKTLIIFTADHGEQLGEHHLINKLGFFDGSYRLPAHFLTV